MTQTGNNELLKFVKRNIKYQGNFFKFKSLALMALNGIVTKPSWLNIFKKHWHLKQLHSPENSEIHPMTSVFDFIFFQIIDISN